MNRICNTAESVCNLALELLEANVEASKLQHHQSQTSHHQSDDDNAAVVVLLDADYHELWRLFSGAIMEFASVTDKVAYGGLPSPELAATAMVDYVTRSLVIFDELEPLVEEDDVTASERPRMSPRTLRRTLGLAVASDQQAHQSHQVPQPSGKFHRPKHHCYHLHLIFDHIC